MPACAVRLGCALISFLQTRLNPQSPRLAMIRIATGGPTCPDRMPIITTPTGPVPIHMVTIPITRDRAAGGTSVRIKVVCMFEKAAVPSPPISNSTNASEYHGDRAIVARPIRNSSDHCNAAEPQLPRLLTEIEAADGKTGRKIE